MREPFKNYGNELNELREWIVSNMELKNRKDGNKWRRYYMMYYIRYRYGLSNARVGSFFGKDHATVINGIKQYEILEQYPDFQETVHDLKMLYPLEKYVKHTTNTVAINKSLMLLEANFHRLQRHVIKGLL